MKYLNLNLKIIIPALSRFLFATWVIKSNCYKNARMRVDTWLWTGHKCVARFFIQCEGFLHSYVFSHRSHHAETHPLNPIHGWVLHGFGRDPPPSPCKSPRGERATSAEGQPPPKNGVQSVRSTCDHFLKILMVRII